MAKYDVFDRSRNISTLQILYLETTIRHDERRIEVGFQLNLRIANCWNDINGVTVFNNLHRHSPPNKHHPYMTGRSTVLGTVDIRDNCVQFVGRYAACIKSICTHCGLLCGQPNLTVHYRTPGRGVGECLKELILPEYIEESVKVFKKQAVLEIDEYVKDWFSPDVTKTLCSLLF